MQRKSTPTFSELVKAELVSARMNHVDNITTYHEAYAVILEELDDLRHEIFQKQSQRSNAVLLKEMVQIATRAQRCAEDLGLVRAI